VVGPQGVDLDLFYTLPTALGTKWEFEHLLLERDTFTLELVPDVHRAHGVANAIVVIRPGDPRAYHRLCIAHAWREGVRRFILLFADQRPPSERATSELEQELRVLLDELGDGGAAPCLRTALTRCAGRTDPDTHDAMVHLLAEIERVFPPDDAPIVDAPLPAGFAREDAILSAIAPLVRSVTMIGTRHATREATATLRDGTGGSHREGWPYLPASEPWPTCPKCKRELPCFMQLDMRDVLHAPPPAHRLYVIYRCSSCYVVVIRHYDELDAERRPCPVVEDDGEAQVIVMERRAHNLPAAELVEADHPDVVAQLQRIDRAWERLYWLAESASGMRSLRIPDHLGGYHTAFRPAVPTCACDAKLYLVSSTQHGDWWNNIWACPEHPDLALHTFDK
jgi:hypothetical protein